MHIESEIESTLFISINVMFRTYRKFGQSCLRYFECHLDLIIAYQDNFWLSQNVIEHICDHIDYVSLVVDRDRVISILRIISIPPIKLGHYDNYSPVVHYDWLLMLYNKM